MANVTDNPLAVLAREAFEAAASQPPRKGLSISLPEIPAGLSFSGSNEQVAARPVGDMSRSNETGIA